MRSATLLNLSVACILTIAIIAGCGGGESGEYKSFSDLKSTAGNEIIVPENALKDESEQAVLEHGISQTSVSSPNESESTEQAQEASPEENANGTTTIETESAKIPDSIQPVIAQKPVTEEQRDVKLLIPQKAFRVEGPENAFRVSYDDINLLKVLNMEPVTAEGLKQMPGWLKGLDGKRIRIRGFMSPSFEPTGLRAFLLGRDNQACCFPGRAKVYDLFFVRMRDGETTDFIDNRPFDVVGVFHITPRVEDNGKVSELYQIDDALVIEK